jgi:phthiocerol/phenolphthiocerol synthesis type-I polyketide synthase B
MSEPQTKPRGIPVAIVGIGCRFPGDVIDAESFWRLLSESRDAVTEIPPDRIDLRRYFDPSPATPGRMMTRWGGFLAGIDHFDADFFNMSPREAERLDPTQRLLLETAWEAFEDAGQNLLGLNGTRTGVFVGQWLSDFEGRVFSDPEAVDFYTAQGSGRYASSGRICYSLGLRGPSITLDTACSSSLVAIHLAVQSIRSGESDIALAGGANIILQPHINIAYSQSRMMAADGRCKFGDASGDGYVRSEGVALVVLKSMETAIADGDRVYAVIRGSAINNDGDSSGSLGTPSRIGQEELLRAAYGDAGIQGGAIDYIEAHGTGTRAGDPVELGALASVLAEGRERGRNAFVGSIKTNFGHTEAAAGVAGVIKTALALYHCAIPSNLHHKVPSPLIPWADLPVLLPCIQVSWPEHAGPRFAGVSGFGIAGTNAHIVLENAPPSAILQHTDQSLRSEVMLPLSAKSPSALRALAARYADMLGSESQQSLYDVCWSAATRRTPLDHRAVFVAADRSALVEILRNHANGGAATAEGSVRAGEAPKIGFVCPGQGGQWVGMARQLMAQEPEFLAALERCDGAARSFVDWSIVGQLTAESGSPQFRLERIDVIQPVLAAVTIAYATLLRSFGIEPTATVGHSMGEVAAACIAGVMSLDQAMRVICRRSALLQKISGRGAMALVELSTKETAARLVGREERLSVAVSNSPRSSVISGDPEAMQQVMSELERDNVLCRLVKVDVASHSPQTAPLADELVKELAGLAPNDSHTPLWSTVLGRRAEGHEFDANYWGRNLRETVRFTDAINGMLNDGVSAFVELGPHPVLLHSIAQTSQAAGHEIALATCGRREDSDRVALLTALGQLWASGYPIDWGCIFPTAGRVVSLPLYPWKRERHWVATAELRSAPTNVRLLDGKPEKQSRDWVFGQQWKVSDSPGGGADGEISKSFWLVLSADEGVGSALTTALRSAGATAISSSMDQLETAVEKHARSGEGLLSIFICARDDLDAPYLPVRALQAVLNVKWTSSPKLWLGTRGGQAVDNRARVSPNQAALWGAARAVAEEHPEFWGGLVDFDPTSDDPLDGDLFVRHLKAFDGENQIAFRGGRRYVLRLAAAGHDADPEAFIWRADGAYLITGGLGDIGLRFARTLALRGARRLILMGRTPLPPREQWDRTDPASQQGGRIAAIRALEAEGLSVHVAAVDVSDEVQLRQFLDRYESEAWPPIRGVIHAAGALDDRLASTLSRADFDALVGPKLRGAQHLDHLLPDLDLFVMVSSISALLPPPGQANYAAANAGLDAIAHDRHARGLAALSIGWGVWDNTGLVKGESGRRNVAELTRQGIGTLSPESGTRLFAWLCGHHDSYLAVLPICWSKFRQARGGRDLPLLRDLTIDPSDGPAQTIKFKERLASAALAERRRLLTDLVRAAVGKVLKISPSRIDPRRAMGTMGLNSLMAMELRNRLEAELERPLSATLAWNYPTVDALAAYLADTESAIVPVPTTQPRADFSKLQKFTEMSDEQALASLRGRDGVSGLRQ